MEPILFDISLLLDDPTSMYLVCKSWYNTIREEQDATITGIFRNQLDISPFERARDCVIQNDTDSILRLSHCRFLPIQWKWCILYVKSMKMLRILQPVIGDRFYHIGDCIQNHKPPKILHIPRWIGFLLGGHSLSKLALAILQQDATNVDLILSANPSIVSILRMGLFQLMAHKDIMDHVMYIHYIVAKIDDIHISSVLKNHSISIRPMHPSTDILPARSDYPWSLNRNNIIDIIRHDRVDLLSIGCGMSTQEKESRDDGMKSFITRIDDLIGDVGLMWSGINMKGCSYVKRWISYMSKQYGIRCKNGIPSVSSK